MAVLSIKFNLLSHIIIIKREAKKYSLVYTKSRPIKIVELRSGATVAD